MQRAKYFILSLIGCGLALVACQQNPVRSTTSDPWGVVRIARGTSMRIRLALSVTDQNIGPLGIEQVRGAEIAARQFETIQGFSVALDEDDPACSTDGGNVVAKAAITQNDLLGIIGMTCSSSCLAAAPVLDGAHITMISPSCGAGELVTPVTYHDSFVTTSYPANLEGAIAARFAFNELGARKAAVLSYEEFDASDAVAAFKTAFEASGGEVTMQFGAVPGQVSYQSELARLSTTGVEIIYAPLFPIDAVNFTIQFRNSSSSSNIRLLGGRYYSSKWFITKTERAADGIYAVGPSIGDTALKTVSESFRAIYGEEPTGTEYAFAYDAMHILLEAAKKVAFTDSDGNLVVGRKALNDAVKHTSAYMGTTGDITCTAWGECAASNTVAVSQVRGGAWVVVFIP